MEASWNCKETQRRGWRCNGKVYLLSEFVISCHLLSVKCLSLYSLVQLQCLLLIVIRFISIGNVKCQNSFISFVFLLFPTSNPFNKKNFGCFMTYLERSSTPCGRQVAGLTLLTLLFLQTLTPRQLELSLVNIAKPASHWSKVRQY